MNTKARIDRIYKKLKLDRCQVCIKRPLTTAVIYEGDAPPNVLNCERCGRSLLLIVEVVYVDNPLPDWFLAGHPGADTETVRQLWQQYLDEHERQYLSRHAGPLAL